MNTFDALGYSESLTDIGVPENQAKLQAKALSEAFDSNDLATKSDITRLESKITELKADVKAQIFEMELRIIKWQIGGIGIVIAAIKFL